MQLYIQFTYITTKFILSINIYLYPYIISLKTVSRNCNECVCVFGVCECVHAHASVSFHTIQCAFVCADAIKLIHSSLGFVFEIRLIAHRCILPLLSFRKQAHHT